MSYTVEQEEAINSVARRYYHSPEYIKKLLDETPDDIAFDVSLSVIQDSLHDMQMDMELDAYEGSYDYEGEDNE